MKRLLQITAIIFCILFIPMYAKATEITQANSSDFVIVLDPGHGGKDPGAVRVHNGVTYSERDIVLKIANYCKEELEKYARVQVHLTRTNNASTLMDRRERTDFALEKKADVIVSLHINSTGETYGTASGAMVYCPYTNTDSGKESQELAKVVLEKLAANVGFKNRGILVDEELGMIKYPKESGVPGILIEHGFINNSYDVQNFLSVEAKVKAMGIADAQALVEYYNLNKGYENYEEDSGTMVITPNEQGTEYLLSTDGVSDAYAVTYAICKKGESEDKIIWKDGTRNKQGQWESKFIVSDYKKKGTYQIETYVIDQKQNKTRVASSEIHIEGPKVNKIATQNLDSSAGTFEVQVSGLTSETSIKKVTVKVWAQEDKSDIHTYKATKQEDGNYTVIVDSKNHSYYYGKYYFYVYARDNNGILKRFTKKSLDFEMPDLHMKAWGNTKKTKYSVSLDKPLGITAVRIAVWSKKSGQNDLKWYNAKVNSKNRWMISVPIVNHKSSGTYYADVYGTNEAGKEIYLSGKTFQVYAPKINEITISDSNLELGTFLVNVGKITAKAGIEKVTVKAWTSQDMSDQRTYKASLQETGNYQAEIQIKNHNDTYGTYQLKIYVKDKRGIIKTKKWTHEFIAPVE